MYRRLLVVLFAFAVAACAQTMPVDYSSSKSPLLTSFTIEPVVAVKPQRGISQRCADGEATRDECKVHWAGALKQTLTYLAVQDASLANTEDGRTTFHGKWWKQYEQAIKADRFNHWNDGDPFFMNYIGHPMQGAVVGFAFIDNDPRGQTLEFANSRPYWMSRFRATLWAAAYEFNWEMGPLGEAGIGFEGKDVYYSPASHGFTNGAGWTDFVATPVGGAVWMVSEDLVDKHFTHARIRRTHNKLALLGLSALNPNRATANLMRLKWPWYRDGE